jgi:hypothetical protein
MIGVHVSITHAMNEVTGFPTKVSWIQWHEGWEGGGG